MKKILFFFSILTIIETHAQKISGEITYDEEFVSMSIDTSQIQNDYTKSIILHQMEGMKKALSGEKALYILNFNNTEALFKPIPMMTNDANPFLKLAVPQTVYYTNLEDGENFEQIEFYGETYRIVKKKKILEWTVTGKSKNILGYLCYHATTKIKRHSGLITIEAWFTNEIPISFGPKGYSGLPGLILGIKELGRYMFAKEIKLSKKNVDIELSEVGKLISEEEFNQMINGTIQKLKNN